MAANGQRERGVGVVVSCDYDCQPVEALTRTVSIEVPDAVQESNGSHTEI